MDTVMSNELGDFLRSRREAVRPEDVGLPAGGRRQTPGLRRSEVATLADVSVEYITRLEQGRDAHPSVQVLAALADALRLTDADRDHLHQLASISQGTELCAAGRRAAARQVRPNVQVILDTLYPAPAVVVNHLTDVLAWNDAYDRLMRPLGLLDGEMPNLIQFLFTDPRARDGYRDWAAISNEQVAYLHGQRHGDPAVEAFAASLTTEAGGVFSDIWQRRPLTSARPRVDDLTHPEVGLLRLNVESLELIDRDYQSLIVYTPADTSSAARLDQIVGRHPGALRALSSSSATVDTRSRPTARNQ